VIDSAASDFSCVKYGTIKFEIMRLMNFLILLPGFLYW